MTLKCATCGTEQIVKVDDEPVTSENWTADHRVRTGYVYRCLSSNHWFTIYEPLPELEQHGELIPSDEHGHRALIGYEYYFFHAHKGGASKAHLHGGGEEHAALPGIVEWLTADQVHAIIDKAELEQREATKRAIAQP